MDSPTSQQPLELILARNLLTSISTPGFLLDPAATVLFFNEAAAAFLGRSFEDVGRMTAEQWTATFGPLDDEDRPIAVDQTKTSEAIRNGRPAHAAFRVRTAGGTRTIEASAFPIVTSSHGPSGAMVLFWPLAENGGAPRRES